MGNSETVTAQRRNSVATSDKRRFHETRQTTSRHTLTTEKESNIMRKDRKIHTEREGERERG